MNAELRGEDKAAASDDELDKSQLEPVESNDNEDTPSKLFEEERKQIKLSYLGEPTSGKRRVGISFLCPA
ncbi:POU domain, class 6, transcription factor 2, partial [Ophiophagus hannah]